MHEAENQTDTNRKGAIAPAGGDLLEPVPLDRYRGMIFRGVPTPRAGTAPPHRPYRGRDLPAGEPVGPVAQFDPEEVAFVGLVLKRAGLDLRAYRLTPLVRRISACLRALRAASLEEAVGVVTSSAEGLEAAINALLIGTTGFFRDPLIFSTLEREVIPHLLERRAHPLVWSAACSDGSELYSVAMLLAEKGSLLPGQLRGTDCREKSIRSGHRGTYSAIALEGLCHSRLTTHLQRHGALYEIRPELKAATRWEEEDLMRCRPEPGSYDLILCRNVAIYLDPEAVQTLWERLARALRPGGYLVVGKAEKVSVPGLHRSGPCIYFKSPSA